MADLQLRVTLLSGKTHRIPVDDYTDPVRLLQALRDDELFASGGWLFTPDGVAIPKTAIAEVLVEPVGSGRGYSQG